MTDRRIENVLIATNTITYLEVNGKNYEYQYILKEEEELFDILSYKNEILISDEKYQNSENYTFRALNKYGSVWRIFCTKNECEVLYYSNALGMELTKYWSLKLSEFEIENLKKRLTDTAKNKYTREINTETDYRMSFENGKEYHYAVSDTEFKKILSGLIKTDFNEIEKEYMK